MSDKFYTPPKPSMNTYNNDNCDCPPNRCGEGGYPPPPGPIPCEPPNPWGPNPEPNYHQIPPIPTVLEGTSLYEAMNKCVERVNVCINQWNLIQRNCFAAMNACVDAARANDVYYDDKEVKYTTGYDETEGCAYSLVIKKAVDRANRPIIVSLELAYDNTTNSGVNQSIFDVSFIKSANVIMTAVPVNQSKWYGPAMYHGMQIPGEVPDDEQYFVYGFNRHGALRYFAQNADYQTLCQNGMVDVIGGCTPLISDGKILNSVANLNYKASIQAIGYNVGTGDVIFFACSAQDQPGMSGASVAKVLEGYGCTTAVITNMVAASELNETGGMMYMGQMATVPQSGKTPSNLAYWVISKRPCFKSRFEREVADLVQTTGQNAWKTYLLGQQILSFDDRITQNHKDIINEVARATQAEGWLQENINKEVNRALQAEQWLQENINAEVNRATAAEDKLNTKIDDETSRAVQAESTLHEEIVAETARATAAEAQNAQAIQAERLRAINRESEIQAALDKEITARIDADNDIINAIEQEVLARRAADTALDNRIDQVRNTLQGNIDSVEDKVNGITGGQTALPYLPLTGGTLTGALTMSDNNTVTLGRGPTTSMEAATKQYVDDAIAAGGGGGTGGDVSKEYVDQQVANLQTQMDAKVSRDGDSMTGALNMQANKIENATLSSNTGTILDDGAGGPGKLTNVATATEPLDAVNLQQVQELTTGNYLELTGGDMTGDINMTGASVIKFYDPEGVVTQVMSRAATTASSTALSIKPSNLAKKLGLTKELLQNAQDKGLDVNNASIGDVVQTLDLDPNAIVGQIYRGAVYNDDTDMVIASDTGKVMLKGTEVDVSDGEGNEIPVNGVSSLATSEGVYLERKPDGLDVITPLRVKDVNGNTVGMIAGGILYLAPHIIQPSTDNTANLDIISSNTTAIVNITTTAGKGKGTINLSKINSPDNLTLAPAGYVDFNNVDIRNVKDYCVPRTTTGIGLTAGQTTDPDGVVRSHPRIVGYDLTEPVDSTHPVIGLAGRTTSSGTPYYVKLRGVSDGEGDYDAVNVKQLNSIKNSVMIPQGSASAFHIYETPNVPYSVIQYNATNETDPIFSFPSGVEGLTVDFIFLSGNNVPLTVRYAVINNRLILKIKPRATLASITYYGLVASGNSYAVITNHPYQNTNVGPIADIGTQYNGLDNRVNVVLPTTDTYAKWYFIDFYVVNSSNT